MMSTSVIEISQNVITWVIWFPILAFVLVSLILSPKELQFVTTYNYSQSYTRYANRYTTSSSTLSDRTQAQNFMRCPILHWRA